ncbi:LON peptidase substrate-binding domain-containing protein [Gordonia sp. ABSL1-1]|uniref:LON peptidase substrate-binding domain-containing protein n=1 Tax=Gordonia sp. ABSL1-1 TaxID=3053923 RepID=UPI0025723D94|nr:LON peptidase substrate-binding domain-containing protein [Gordonia sp. ABSL1-1]MDL9936160.1 LON peptidase substrate-binding domain-containing protein [Gordonia sp. ABSL1-1]
MFPLGTALLPGEPLPLRIFEPRYREMLSDCLDSDEPRGFGVVLIARGSEVGGGEVRHDVGTFARIETVDRESDGRAALICVGTRRLRVLDWLPDDPYPRARVVALPESEFTAEDHAVLGPLAGRIRDLIGRIGASRGVDPTELQTVFDADRLHRPDGPAELYRWAAHLPVGALDRQYLLEATDTAAAIAVLTDAVDGFAARVEFDV